MVNQRNLHLRHDRDVNDIVQRRRRVATVGSRLCPPRLHPMNCRTCITNADHLVNELQLWNPHGHKDLGNQLLQHNRELSTNLMNCNCGTSTVFCRV